MLAISRKETETIFLDVPPSKEPQRVAVSLSRLYGTRAVLGIDAAREVKILRAELEQPASAS